MGDKPLTKKILEEILDMKLMPLKARIDDLTDKMKDFRKIGRASCRERV